METTETSGGRRGALLAAVAGAAAIVIALVVTSGPGEAKNLATIDVVQPGVSARFGDDDTFTTVAAGQALTANDVVRTSSTGMAKITYFDGSITRIGPSSDLTIDQVSRSGGRTVQLTLGDGRSWHRVHRATDAAARFEVRHGDVAVLATDSAFAMTCLSQGECRVDVIDGSVQVKTPSKTTTVDEDESVSVSGSRVGTVEALDVDDWIVDNKRLDGQIDDRPTDGADTSTTVTTVPDIASVDPDTDVVDDDDDQTDVDADPKGSTTTRPPAQTTTTTAPRPTTTTTTPGDEPDPARSTTTTIGQTTTTVDGDSDHY